jgi:hypothetical protein
VNSGRREREEKKEKEGRSQSTLQPIINCSQQSAAVNNQLQPIINCSHTITDIVADWQSAAVSNRCGQ